MAGTMRAVVLEIAPAPPEGLKIKNIPIPKAEKGKVLIQVKAFGLNRSELHTRIGLAEGVTFPRVLGIEACGVVAECPGGEFKEGQQVCAMMGGMGRVYDGGYAEYTLVPVDNVHALHAKTLSWATLGAIPEMLQTAYGSLTIGCDIQKGQSILIRGGTSSIGMAAAVLAKQRGMTVFSTTRNENKAQVLKEKVGVDHIIIDDGKDVASKVREIAPKGVDCALELVGADTLKDTLRAVKVKGTVCFTGMLSNSWIIKDFYPMGYIPNGVRLTAYGGGAADLPGDVLQAFINSAEAGHAYVPIDKVFKLDQIAEAHAYMESGMAVGKLVVETGM